MIMHAVLAGALACLPVAGRCACSISVSSLAFGAYDPTAAAATTFNGSVTVTCTAGSGVAGYNIQLTTGGGGSYAGRQMAAGGSALSYQIFSDSTRSQVWGDGTGGSSSLTGIDLLPLTGGTRVLQVYGQIAAKLAVTPGSYLDSLTATLTY